MAVLRVGSTGGQVADIQRRLAAAGLNPGAVDGVFGPATMNALLQFQQAHGINADGVWGPQTEATMKSLHGAGPGQPAPTGGAPGPSGAPLSPEQDPAYLRFIASQGVREDELRAYTRMRQDALQQELINRVGSMEHQAGTDVRAAGDSFGARGKYLSGARVQGQERILAQSRLGQTEAQTATQNQQNDMAAQLQSNVASLRRGSTEAGMQTRSQLPINNAEQGLY